MRNPIPAVAIMLSIAASFSGCKKQELCASDDSQAVCNEVQQCFRSGTSVEVCREAEKEANAIETNKKGP